MIKDDPSLIEVWEMKDAAWKAFLDSGYINYSDYINESTKDIIEKYHIEYFIKPERQVIRK